MKDPLANNRVDMTVAGIKAIASLIPGAGGIVSELIGQIIPSQRLDRVVEFLREVDKRLCSLELNKEATTSKEFIDLFEDATIQAMRALSRERLEWLAIFIANAAVDGDEFHSVDKRLIQILAELTDADLEILRAFNVGFVAIHRLEQRHRYSNPVSITAFETMSDQQKNTHDARSVEWNLHLNTLERLGLIEARFARSHTSDGPEFDRFSGKPRVTGHEITQLGRLLIRRIGAQKMADATG